ncbi:MAG TPA: serine protease [Pirellulales bacterium]|nr:serine protease [Pirellulales bacterium]
MKRLSASIVVLLLLCAPAAGQWPSAPWSGGSSASQNPAVVRIVATGRDSISYGSGSLVAKSQQHGLIITNWHVINEATGQITIMFPDGFSSAGTVVKIDRDWDLAAIAIWRPNAEPLPLATLAPQPGETLTIAGYGSGNYRAASGRCTQYVAPGTSFPFEMVELATTARQGDSGGPILNSRGELAGVLFGEGGGRTAGSYCGRVQWFLAGLAPPDGTDAAGGMLAASASPLNAQPISNSRLAQVPVNPLAPPSQPGARVGSLASLGLPAGGQTSNRSAAAPPRAIAPTATFASTAGPGGSSLVAQNSSGWQSAAPRGLANPDRDPPRPRPRPAAPDDELGNELVEVPRVRGIPDAAALGNTSRVIAPTAGDQQDSLEQTPDDGGASIGWTDIAGHTLGEQVKTVLATIGGLAVFMQAISLLSRDAKPAKKKEDEEEGDD